MKYNKKGFTLVELLAVIAILGLILTIAVPMVIDTINSSKIRTLELNAQSIIKAAEEKYLENSTFGIVEEITCENISDISNNDYESCKIEFDEDGTATVTIVGKGSYDGLLCTGIKDNVVCE